ncbi:MAG: trehalase family glycosidase [Alistipes sp.]
MYGFRPLDLNANLFMYEVNFARFAQELGRTDEIREWIAKAELRRARILQYCYDPEAKQFYDYDYVNGRRSTCFRERSRAPLPGAVPREYAGDIVQALIPYGIAACEDKPYDYPTSGPIPTRGPRSASMR